jgi:hypothetical protein
MNSYVIYDWVVHQVLYSFEWFLKLYLHFLAYCADYIFLINIFFNQLILNSKWDFLNNIIPWGFNYFIPSTICKKPFQY